MKGACSTCRHWRDNEDFPIPFEDIRKDFKICNRAVNHANDDFMMMVATIISIDDRAEVAGAISTGPNFCCKHYLSRG